MLADSSCSVVHVVSSISKIMGGPSRSSTGICQALARHNVKVQLCTLDTRKVHGEDVQVDEDLIQLHRAPCRVYKRLKATFSRSFGKCLSGALSGADLLHSHGVWEPVNRTAARTAGKLDKPHVISTRGMLDPKSYGRFRWKKDMARRLFVDRALRDCACIHVTAPLEAQSIRSPGFTRPIAVIPNGLTIADYHRWDKARARAELCSRWPELEGKSLLLFLSRIHPSKGTRELIAAWSEVCDGLPDWHLVVAGPDALDHRRQLEADLASHGKLERATFVGPIYGDTKLAMFAASDLFVLPSYSENFGIVVAEALASGAPAITTVGTPWTDLPEFDCGWRIDLGVEALTRQLKESMSLASEELAEMGERGRKVAARRYSWDTIAEDMKSVYNWILFGSDMPSCVRLD